MKKQTQRLLHPKNVNYKDVSPLQLFKKFEHYQVYKI